MPAPDEALRDFFSNNEVFAGLFNGFLFNNEMVINPEELQPVDSAYSETVEGSKVKKYRDIVRRTSVGKYVIIAIENQNKIHYAMPVRKILYDALEYSEQIKKVSMNSDADNKKWSADEYLSKVKKGTKIEPVVTVVFYTGEQEWDGPKTLREMFDVPEKFSDYVPDYPVYVVDMGHDKELKFDNKQLRELRELLVTIHSRDTRRNDVVGADIASLAGILIGNKRLYNEAQEKEEVEMWTVFQEYEDKIDELEKEVKEVKEAYKSEIEAYKNEADAATARVRELEAQLAMYTGKKQ